MTRFRKVGACVVFVLSAVLTSTNDAHALMQPKHYAISTGHCANQDMPPSFCNRLAVDDHNVDHEAWYEMAAHAQTPDGASRCDAANMAVTFVHDRARRVRTSLRELRSHLDEGRDRESVESIKDIAVALGQILHSTQDNCAHSGMTNPQHAWLSLNDTCNGDGTDPDSQDAAIACAEDGTAQVMKAFANAVSSAGIQRQELALYRKKAIFWPTREEACEYYASARTWDGKDTRWNTDVMALALREAIMDGMNTDNGALDDVCGSDDTALRPAQSQDMDTSQGKTDCMQVQARCVGAGEDMGALAPGNVVSTQGCSNVTPGAAELAALAWLVVMAARRRRA